MRFGRFEWRRLASAAAKTPDVERRHTFLNDGRPMRRLDQPKIHLFIGAYDNDATKRRFRVSRTASRRLLLAERSLDKLNKWQNRSRRWRRAAVCPIHRAPSGAVVMMALVSSFIKQRQSPSCRCGPRPLPVAFRGGSYHFITETVQSPESADHYAVSSGQIDFGLAHWSGAQSARKCCNMRAICIHYGT